MDRRLLGGHAPLFGRCYINFLMDEGQDRVRASYQRLAEVKAAYNPDNVFRVNHNIAPQA